MYHYIIAPARDSIRSRGIHSPLHGPNSRCASLLPVTLLFPFFPIVLHVHYVTVPICPIIPCFYCRRSHCT